MKELPNLNTVIIVQARMGATRLPGKPLMRVLEKPLLGYLLERVKRVKLANQVVVATTKEKADEAIVQLSQSYKVKFYQGSQEDVLDRYYQAASLADAEVIVRITGDCPLIDPEIISQTLYTYLSHFPEFDYVSNTVERTYPRGMDVEVFSFKALEAAHLEAKSREEREHVSPFIYQHPERFRIYQMTYPQDLSLYRWTVDTPEDFKLIEKILEEIYPDNTHFNLEDLVNLLDKHPEWSAINAHIKQKAL